MSEPAHCDLCGRELPPQGHYIVRIDVFADPSMPPLTSGELAEMDFDQAFKDLINEMKGMSAEDLQDQVHRRFEYKLCRVCHIKFLVNPLGKPREIKIGKN